ncbi:MAG: hypothetical protein P8Y71_16625 [Pseudolabrys sp.]
MLAKGRRARLDLDQLPVALPFYVFAMQTIGDAFARDHRRHPVTQAFQIEEVIRSRGASHLSCSDRRIITSSCESSGKAKVKWARGHSKLLISISKSQL